ncbi:MAG TPA: quinone oxidoreductase [Candidatus Baltobacteraceae bacterium]
MNALSFERFGGPEVLRYGQVPDPQPAGDEVLVRTGAIGLNFADVYRRRGNYHLAGAPPYVAGYEAAGAIVGTGERVAFADSPFANAELVAVPREKLIPLPDDISDETAAALLLQGLTAYFLTHDSHAVRAGERVLVHAAAGGVGLLLVQIAKLLGAYVVGLASSEPKRAAVLEAGADRALSHDAWQSERDFDVVYDAVGSTLGGSLAAARTGGRVVFYGMAGGDPKPVDPRVLMDRSLTLTGGDLWNVLRSNADRVTRAEALFGWVREGRLRVRVAERFPLSRGAEAHRLLESRAAIGKILLVP